MSTGIALFTYNRPDHLRQVLVQLKKNDVSHLFIFSDGPADRSERPNVREVRSIISGIDWCSTTVEAREENLGLADSITRGIDRVFADHDRIIVLEDDCVPSSNFISFMNTCLDRYADTDEVMNINGYSPPIDIPGDYDNDIYFTYRSSSWGWGTWESAWEQYEREPFTLQEFESRSNEIKNITRKAGTDLYPMMRRQLQGEIDSWAVWWSYTIAKRNGICVNPVNSKIVNIGHDGTGTHSGAVDRFEVDLDDTPPEKLSFPDQPHVVDELNLRYNRFIRGGRRNRIKRYLANTLKRIGGWNVYKQVRRRI